MCSENRSGKGGFGLFPLLLYSDTRILGRDGEVFFTTIECAPYNTVVKQDGKETLLSPLFTSKTSR